MEINRSMREVHGEYDISYRDIKHPRLEFKTGKLLVVLPKDYKNETALLEKYSNWIRTKEIIIENALHTAEKKILNLERTKQELRNLVFEYIEDYRRNFGFCINNIFYRKMRTKWGSYSGNNNLTLNTMLKYLPENLIKYVVFHELLHSIERKHNEAFWRHIKQEFPEHNNIEHSLLVYWFLIQNKKFSDYNYD